MNTPPRSQIPINTPPYPTEFQQIIREKSQNFVGREFVFTAIHKFLHQYSRGYFTLIGAPGSGKSAILAQYVTENPQVIYYNAQVAGKNQADQFLTILCHQLMGMGNGDKVMPDNATEGSWFLSLLLQKISDQLEPHQRLIITIDALDAVDCNSQSPDSNLFYLPRYLPEKIYFILTRRPFVRERSRLLLEAPSQILDLGDYPEQNRKDIQAYIRQYLTPLTPLSKGGTGEIPSTSLDHRETGEESGDRISPLFFRGAGGDLNQFKERLIQQLTAQSENNFMVLSHILDALAQGFYPEPYQ
ncbi:AAA family ATPase, partial [Coleofasciculus sp. LEGE 07092]|uniref:AAA family ATPase n=2 Tax=unclassified Coleofasciculus TaxID=2692782 RepID=UPI00187FDCF7